MLQLYVQYSTVPTYSRTQVGPTGESAILGENGVRIAYSAKTENATTCTENGHIEHGTEGTE